MPNPTPLDPASAERGGDGVSQIKSRAAELGENAAAAIDARRDAVAGRIESAASTLRDKAESLPGGEKVERAADAMESAADYVRDTDVNEMLSDLRQLIRNHPGATLLTAAALGFLLARKLARR